MEIREILEKYKNNEINEEECEKLIARSGYVELGGVKLDTLRKKKRNYGEVIYCESKTEKHLLRIFSGIDTPLMGTRCSREKYEFLAERVDNLTYNEDARIVIKNGDTSGNLGRIAICTGGTSDIPVAEEAALTAEFMGANVDRFYDVGVAGIHRLLSNIEDIRKANAVVAVAGMEGALGTVIAGMVEVPVICVPTSVGYGANFKGMSALLTMINSCAEGVSVVNIDNGFGAGYLAAQINNLIERKNI